MTDYQFNLLEKLANATVTYYQCNGHAKAERNLFLMREYREQLKAMECEIPSDKELLERGKFNGEGSS
jgi:hypothetical protein